jgi:hypothetical protein
MNEIAGGWWFVQFDDKQGWAPASFLEPQTRADQEKDDPKELAESKTAK